MLYRNMTTIRSSLAHLSDDELLVEVTRLAEHERQATSRLIASLAELDERRLYLGQGCSSLFTYCTQILHLSEHAAYGRIEAARVARRFPVVLELLAGGSIFDRALTLLLADLERKKLAATERPLPRRASSQATRHIPAEVRRRVWARDSGRCAFVGASGRCTEQGFLEFHHVVPYAAGGLTTLENLELRCRSHNAYEAEQYFGSLLARETQPLWGGPTRPGPSWVVGTTFVPFGGAVASPSPCAIQ